MAAGIHSGELMDYANGRIANAVTVVSQGSGRHSGSLVDLGAGKLATAVQAVDVSTVVSVSGNVANLSSGAKARALTSVLIGSGVHSGGLIDLGNGKLTRPVVEITGSLSAGQIAAPAVWLDSTGALTMTRESFVAQMLAVPGSANVAFLWAAKLTDTTTSTTDDTNARTITWDGSVASRLSAQGAMAVQTFNGTSQTGSAPDTASLSFGNGTTDLAFSIVALANVTDTAAPRYFVAKFNNGGGQREWGFNVSGADLLQFLVYDNSATALASRTSDAAVTQGSLRLYAATYDGSGGATAMNGVTLYQDATAIASTASNNASYVAMENTTAPLTVGSLDAATGQWFSGSEGFVMLCLGALTPTQLGTIRAITNAAYGLSL